MYRELLYSEGGGIINSVERLSQGCDINIAIGIGGTGIDCLRVIKRRVFETLRPDDPDEEEPCYSRIKFLAVDTDRNEVRKDGRPGALDAEKEFFCTSDIMSFWDPDSASAFLTEDLPELAWLNKQELNRGAFLPIVCRAMDGAGGIRQVGRLYMIEQSAAFRVRLGELIMEALTGVDRSARIFIHIFSGLGGGTGSGSFLDVCYLVQNALVENGLRDRATLLGYFFQPHVRLSMFQEVKHDAAAYMFSNGYAALKELDYCMSFETNGGEWEQQYIGFRIGPTKKHPVDQCFLIDDGHIDRYYVRNRYEYVMNVVTEHVMQFLVRNTARNVFSVPSLFYGFRMPVEKKHGACFGYTAIGASEAAVPIKEISTYLGSKLFETFSVVRNNHPTRENIEMYAREIGVQAQSMMNLLTDGTDFAFEIPPFEEQVFRSRFTGKDAVLTGELRLPEEITNYFCQNTDRVISQVEKNIAEMRSGWTRKESEQDCKSIAQRAFDSLRHEVIYPLRGPFYAAEVLGGSENGGLISILKQTHIYYQGKINSATDEVRLAMERYQSAREAYLGARFFQNKKRRFGALMEAAADFYTQSLKRNVLIKAEEMIPEVKAQLESLYRECFLPYSEIYGELLDTFRENVLAMRSGREFSSGDDSFSMRVPNMDGRLMDLLDGVVEGGEVDREQEAYIFNNGFFKAFTEWETVDERKIVRYVSKFVNRFLESRQMSMWQYLESQERADPRPAVDIVYREILKRMYLLAEPLYAASRFIDYDPSQRKIEFLFVPRHAEAVQGAFDRFVSENRDLQSLRGNSANRILLLRYLIDVPVFSLEKIDLYRQAYLKNRWPAGRHIYEGTQDDPRDWRRLPDLTPYSLTVHRSAEMVENAQLYDRAVELGIIRGEQYSGVLREAAVYDGSEIREIESLARRVCEEHDAEGAREVIAQIETYLRSREPYDVMKLPGNVEPGFEEIVTKDYVVASEVFMKVIRGQVGIVERLEEIKEQMRSCLMGGASLR